MNAPAPFIRTHRLLPYPLLLVIILLLLWRSSPAQHLERTAVAAAGEQFMAFDYTLDWTLGELMVEDFGNGRLTQGFHQPALQLIDGVTFVKWDYAIKAFPNPFTDELRIDTDYPDPLEFQLFSQTGQLIRTISYPGSGSALNLSGLPNGFYLLTVAANGQRVRNFKLMKTQ